MEPSVLVMVVHALISVLRRQRQVDRFKFKASLVYLVSFRTARPIENPESKKKKRKKKWLLYESMAFSGEEMAAGLEGKREACPLTVTPLFWTPFLRRPGPGLHPAQDT